MTPQQYLELFRERWKAVVAGILLGVLVAAGVVLASPTEYRSSVTMVVSGRSSPDLASAVEGDQLSSQRMQTYVQLVTSPRLAGEVASDLRLGLTGDELAERISASAEPETILLTATVTDEVPARAAEIANTLATRFMRDVAQVEQPADPALNPLVSVKVFEPATPATEPVAPRAGLTIALGGLIGLVVGIGAAVAWNGLDTRVRNRRRLGEIVAAPVLGEVSVARHAGSLQLPMRDTPRAPRAEEYRWMRTNLQHVLSEHDQSVIMVTSPSTGDGKTTVVCNLAIALAAAGKRVLVVEADLRHPRASEVFDVDAGIGLTDVLAGCARLGVVLRRWHPGIDGVSSGPLPAHPGEMLGSGVVPQMLADARTRYDVVLVDTTAMLPFADTAALVPHVDGVVLVVRRDTPARAVEETAEAIEMASGTVLGTILMMASARRADDRDTAAPAGRTPLTPPPRPRPATERPSPAEPADPPAPAPAATAERPVMPEGGAGDTTPEPVHKATVPERGSTDVAPDQGSTA